MPDHPHPHQEIEQRLRAAAETRRRAAGGPFALHPVDRRSLQAEVARTFTPAGREERPAWLAWLFRHRAGLVFYSALALVVMICVPGMLAPAGRKLRQQTTPTTASHFPKPPAAQANGAAPPSVTVEPTPPKAAAPPSPVARAEKSAPDSVVSAPVPTTTSTRAALPPPGKVEARADPYSTAAQGLAGLDAARIQAQAPPREVAARSEAPAALAGRTATTAAGGAEPFSYFRLERNGPAVAVVDADGSVYRGRLLSEPEPDGLPPSAAAPTLGGGPGGNLRARSDSQRWVGASAPTPTTPAAQSYGLSFRVAGTNRSSQQAVRFEGSLPWPADRQHATQTWFRSQVSTQLSITGLRQPVAPVSGTNATLVGELQVGPAAPVRMEARPVNR